MKKQKKLYSNPDRRNFYMKTREWNLLKNKLESLGFEGKGFLEKFMHTITENEFLLLLGNQIAISKVSKKLQ